MKKMLKFAIPFVVIYSALSIAYAQPLEYELPIENSTGYTTIQTKVYDDNGNVIHKMNGGTPFTILKEQDEQWKVETQDGIIGWVNHKFCMINLPDIIPSIIYKNTNGSSSIYRSRGHDLPNVTGNMMYDSYHYNEKLKKDEYIVPCLYSMAKKIYCVQQDALKNGDTLVIYEAYRPYATQMSVVDAMNKIMKLPDVYDGVTGGGWALNWFIATGYSNHQLGYAMDTSIGKVIKSENHKIGKNYSYQLITEYEEYDMQTSMHELSRDSVSLAYGVNSLSKSAWRDVPLAKTMNENAIKLRDYCTSNGLSPLASEWWHFNDLDSRELITGHHGKANWDANVCMSKELRFSKYEWINKIGEMMSIPKEKYQTLYHHLVFALPN